MRNRRRVECKGYGNKCGKGQEWGEKVCRSASGRNMRDLWSGKGNGGKRGRKKADVWEDERGKE